MNSLLGSIKHEQALFTTLCTSLWYILLRRRKEFKGGNHTREYSIKFLNYNYSTNFFGTSAVVVEQAILDFSCVNAVEAQNGFQEIFNSKPNVQSQVEKRNSSGSITLIRCFWQQCSGSYKQFLTLPL